MNAGADRETFYFLLIDLSKATCYACSSHNQKADKAVTSRVHFTTGTWRYPGDHNRSKRMPTLQAMSQQDRFSCATVQMPLNARGRSC